MSSRLVYLGIPLLALALGGGFLLAVERAERALGTPNGTRRRRVAIAASLTAAWLVLLAVLGRSGVLARFDTIPPPMAGWFALTMGIPVAVGLSSVGRRLALGLPLAALVGFQTFRLPLELVMHRAAAVGIMPSVMSYSGNNFDIVTGVTALALGGVLAFIHVPWGLVLAWNLLGLGLLANVAGIAVAASPLFQAFGPDQVNVWVTQFPYVYMSVMVSAALLGHVLVARRLLADVHSTRRLTAARRT